MARASRLRRAYLKQRRSAIDEIRLRDMNRAAHRRARSGIKFVKDVYGYTPVDIDSNFSNFRRKMLGLGECVVTSSREDILAKCNRVRDFAECIFRLDSKAMYLLREQDGTYYFLYRERGSYYKKSILYKDRTRAME